MKINIKKLQLPFKRSQSKSYTEIIINQDDPFMNFKVTGQSYEMYSSSQKEKFYKTKTQLQSASPKQSSEKFNFYSNNKQHKTSSRRTSLQQDLKQESGQIKMIKSMITKFSRSKIRSVQKSRMMKQYAEAHQNKNKKIKLQTYQVKNKQYPNCRIKKLINKLKIQQYLNTNFQQMLNQVVNNKLQINNVCQEKKQQDKKQQQKKQQQLINPIHTKIFTKLSISQCQHYKKQNKRQKQMEEVKQFFQSIFTKNKLKMKEYNTTKNNANENKMNFTVNKFLTIQGCNNDKTIHNKQLFNHTCGSRILANQLSPKPIKKPPPASPQQSLTIDRLKTNEPLNKDFCLQIKRHSFSKTQRSSITSNKYKKINNIRKTFKCQNYSIPTIYLQKDKDNIQPWITSQQSYRYFQCNNFNQ